MYQGGSILLTAPILFNVCTSSDGEDNPSNPGGITIDLTGSKFAVLGIVGGYAYQGASYSEPGKTRMWPYQSYVHIRIVQ